MTQKGPIAVADVPAETETWASELDRLHWERAVADAVADFVGDEAGFVAKTSHATFVQTYATTALTVPAATYAAPAAPNAATASAHTFPANGNLFDAVANDLLINVRDDTVAHAVADEIINIKSLAANMNQAIADREDLRAKLVLANTALAALAADVIVLKGLINTLIDVDQAAGIAT